ncbi:MAG TPA: helix-turn-helix domain-containing protein [Rubrobacter sp.]|jgi:hypothetical protein|nr:helix-turn-helix domain-containing protein [Rubrobacter sp.]
MSGTSGAKEPRRRLSGSERRRAILDAGMRVFAERGYERASMREIARSAGITTPVIYDTSPPSVSSRLPFLGSRKRPFAFIRAASASWSLVPILRAH